MKICQVWQWVASTKSWFSQSCVLNNTMFLFLSPGCSPSCQRLVEEPEASGREEDHAQEERIGPLVGDFVANKEKKK